MKGPICGDGTSGFSIDLPQNFHRPSTARTSDSVKRPHANGFLLGLLSFALSLFFLVVIWKVLFPLMDVRSLITFAAFEDISLPLSITPLVLGVIGSAKAEC